MLLINISEIKERNVIQKFFLSKIYNNTNKVIPILFNPAQLKEEMLLTILFPVIQP